MILAGQSEKSMIGGADIKEFGTPKALAEPNLLSVILAIEHATKPVVAAVNGVAAGAGASLAFAADFRILVDSAGLPLTGAQVPLAWQVARIPLLGRLLESMLPRSLVAQGLAGVYGDPTRITPELVDRGNPDDPKDDRGGIPADWSARIETTWLHVDVGDSIMPTVNA